MSASKHPKTSVLPPRLRSVAVLFAALAVGCMGDPSVAPADGALVDGGLPLLQDTVATEDWTAARPGCEGQLGQDVSLAIASLEHGLIAALDGFGHIVCVDTIEAVSAELEDTGRSDDATTLAARFEASAMASETSEMAARNYMGDPHPEPNDCPSCGDPHPEPN